MECADTRSPLEPNKTAALLEELDPRTEAHPAHHCLETKWLRLLIPNLSHQAAHGSLEVKS